MSKLKIVTYLAAFSLLLSVTSSVNAYGADSGDGRSSDPGATAPKVCSAEKPNAPFLSGLHSAGQGRVTAVWNLVDHASQYAIQYGLSPRNYIYGAANVGNTSSFTIDHLQSGVTYYVAVQAVNGCMPSELSNEQVITSGASGQEMQYETYSTDEASAASAASEVTGEQKKDLFAEVPQTTQPILGFWARIWHSIQTLFGSK